MNSHRLPASTPLASATAPQRRAIKLRPLFLLIFGAVLSANAAGLSDRLSVGGDIGIARRDLDGPLLAQPPVFPGSRTVFRKDSSRTDEYGSVHVGVKVNEFFGIEAGYQDFGSTRVRFIIPPAVDLFVPLPENFRFRDRAFTLDPVFTWKISPRVKLHGFWGLAFNRADVTIEDFFPNIVIPIPPPKSSRTTQSRLGAGADLQLTANLNFRAGVDYQRFSSFTKEGWLTHAGLVYSF